MGTLGRRGSRTIVAGALLLLALLVPLALAGCGTSTTESTQNPGGGQGSSPKRGGSLTITFQSEARTVDPAIAWDLTGTVAEQLTYQTLLRYKAASGVAGTALEPCVATEVPTTQNGGLTNGGKTYVFHIRQGVRFAPPVNRQVTAEDFKYSFERMMGLPQAPATYFYTEVVGATEFQAKKSKHISGVKVIDPGTLEIDLTQPDPAFLNALTMWFCDFVPKEWVQKWGNSQFGRHPLGTGPFMLENWTPGQQLLLKRNPNYWEPGKPYLDEFKFVFSVTPSTALLRLKQGDVDMLGDNIPPADVANVLASPQWKQSVQSQKMTANFYFYMNQQFKPFDNVKVRQALEWAIDRDKLVKLQSGQASTTWQFFPDGMPGHEPGKQYYGYDPAKAKQLLAEAGYPSGFSTTLYSFNVDPEPKIAQSVQNDLAAVGVKASLKLLDRDTFYTLAGTANKTPCGIQDWWMDFPDPSDWVIPLASKSNAVTGGVDSAFWWSPVIEKMLTDSRTMSGQARLQEYSKMQQYIMDQAPYVMLSQPTMTTMSSKNVGGFYLHPVYWFDPVNYWRK